MQGFGSQEIRRDLDEGCGLFGDPGSHFIGELIAAQAGGEQQEHHRSHTSSLAHVEKNPA
jgi:hypothetical protein